MTDSNSSEATDSTADGRSRRRERNVERVLDALIDLAGEGTLDPSGEEIAQRAGVSHRSLYRYFDDRPSLQRAAVERAMQRIAPLISIADLGVGSLDDRIVTFVAARTATYWGFGPIARTAFASTSEEVVREGIDSSRSFLAGQLVAQFAPELDRLDDGERTRTIAILDVAFQFESLEYLVRHCDLTRDDLVEVLQTHLRVRLAPIASHEMPQ